MSASESMRQVKDVTNGAPNYTDCKTDTFAEGSGFGHLVGPESPDFSTAYHIARPQPHQINVPADRAWEMSETHVLMLMESIRKNGLTTPISVRFDGLRKYTLISGLHRLEAIKRLRAEYLAEKGIDPSDPKGTADWADWNEIPAMVYGPKTPPKYLKTLEIVENAHRRQLTDEEKTRFLRIITPQVKRIKDTIDTVGKTEIVEAQKAAEISRNKNVPAKSDGKKPRGNSSGPNIAKEIAAKLVKATNPGLEGKEFDKKVETERVVIGRSFREAKEQVGMPESTPLSADSLLEVSRLADEAVYDEEAALKIESNRKRQMDADRAKRLTDSNIKATVSAAKKKGRDDLVEVIETSDKSDKKGIVLEARKELDMRSPRAVHPLQIEQPAQKSADDIRDVFGDQYAIEMMTRWLETMELADCVKSITSIQFRDRISEIASGVYASLGRNPGKKSKLD